MLVGVIICQQCDPLEPPKIAHYCFNQLRDQVYRDVAGGAELFPPSVQDNVLLNGCDKHDDAHRRRPDYAWASDARVIHLEIDEHSHSDRDVSCERAKLHESHFGVDGDTIRPTLFLRFNPHEYSGGLDLPARLRVLAAELHKALTAPLAELHLDPIRTNVRYLFYGPAGQKHIDAAQQEPQVNVLSHVY